MRYVIQAVFVVSILAAAAPAAPAIPLCSLSWNPFIQSLIDQVSTDSLTAHIQRLQDFKTRMALSESSAAVSQWIADKFTSWGYAAEFDSFYVDDYGWPFPPGYERNVIANLQGSMGLPEYYIIGGHFDTNSTDPQNAPGADDNGSGAAATLETARIMRAYGFDRTVQFICWGAEEVMFDTGASHYAQTAVDSGWALAGMLNSDMIGYQVGSVLECKVYWEGDLSRCLLQLFQAVCATYVPDLITYAEEGATADANAFAYHGFATLGLMEHHFNPNYHSPADLLSALRPDLYTAITKASLATIAILSLSPEPVQGVDAFDVGDGSSVELRWVAGSEPDLVGYTIDFGTASGAYGDSVFVPGAATASHLITNLMADSAYYFIARALDQNGYQSWMATEVSMTPREAPAAPRGVTATPLDRGIRIDWRPNQELDFAGYRVLRRVNEVVSYDTLTASMFAETTYTDQPLSGANRYYYIVQAIDASGHGGALSAEAYGRPITLDQGILIVDETRNQASYPDDVHDAFYRDILQGYRYEEIEYGPDSTPWLADLVPYSTVLWHADDYTEFLAAADTANLAAYLRAGGNLWLTGWKPSSNLGGSSIYPMNFSEGSFMFDYMKVTQASLSSQSDRIQGADGQLGYPRLDVDAAKVPLPAWGSTMRYFESLSLSDDAMQIYTIDVEDDGSSFEGAVCGLRYLGDDFKVFCLGFPLYFMAEEQARTLAQHVMADFGELAGEWPSGSGKPPALSLSQNTPNPFGGETTIRYCVPSAGSVHLGVYDLAGRLVRTLVEAPHERGHHSVGWDGRDSGGTPVASGVYVCRLHNGGGDTSRRMVVVR